MRGMASAISRSRNSQAAVAAQRHLGADGHALAELERRDRATGPGDDGFLAGDHLEVAHRAFDERGLLGRLAHAHVQHDLLEARYLHDIRQTQGVLELGAHRLVVALLQAGTLARRGDGHQQLRSTLAADPHLAAGLVAVDADAGGPVGGAHDGHSRDGQRHVLVDDAALHGLAPGLAVALGHVGTVDDDLPLVGHRDHHVAALAPVLAGQHLDQVTFVDPHHNTSGASDTMRMNRLSRSSRPTGPKMRVPRGCCWSLMSTAAFSSNLM